VGGGNQLNVLGRGRKVMGEGERLEKKTGENQGEGGQAYFECCPKNATAKQKILLVHQFGKRKSWVGKLYKERDREGRGGGKKRKPAVQADSGKTRTT